MNMMPHPGAQCLWAPESLGHDQSYMIAVCIAVDDTGQLWKTAAAHLLSCGIADEEALIELIGPLHDPDTEQCLATLFKPAAFSGVRALGFEAHALMEERIFPLAQSGRERSI